MALASLPPISGSRQDLRTTEIGYVNRNRQTVIHKTDFAGTDHGQKVYVLRCGVCGHEHGANGSDIFQRRCPRHDPKSRGADLLNEHPYSSPSWR